MVFATMWYGFCYAHFTCIRVHLLALNVVLLPVTCCFYLELLCIPCGLVRILAECGHVAPAVWGCAHFTHELEVVRCTQMHVGCM